jgi:hypothetical protein
MLPRPAAQACLHFLLCFIESLGRLPPYCIATEIIRVCYAAGLCICAAEC